MSWEVAYERPDVRGITAALSTGEVDILRTLDSVLALDARTGKELTRFEFSADHSFGYKPLSITQNKLLTAYHPKKDPRAVRVCAIDFDSFQKGWEAPVDWRLNHYGSGLWVGTDHLYLVDNQQRLLRIAVASGKVRELSLLPEARLTEHSFALTDPRLYFVRKDGTVGAWDLSQGKEVNIPDLRQIKGITALRSQPLAWSEHGVYLLDEAGGWQRFGVEDAIRRVRLLSSGAYPKLVLVYKEAGLIGYKVDQDLVPLFDLTFSPGEVPVKTNLFGTELILYLNSWEGYRLLSLNLNDPEKPTEILAGDIVRGEVCFTASGVFLTTDRGLQCLRSDAKPVTHG